MKFFTNVLRTFFSKTLKLLLYSKLLLIYVEKGLMIDIGGWKNN